MKRLIVWGDYAVRYALCGMRIIGRDYESNPH